MDFLIISGMSGAGKTKAVNALEDIGYYCVDNMPPKIMQMFAGLYLDSVRDEEPRVAMVVDARSREMFSDLTQTLEEMKRGELRCRILFLDAADEVLLQRYKETRRRHPLMDDDAPTLPQAIRMERELMTALRETADYVIDTSRLSAAQLRERVLALAAGQGDLQPMSISCISFGFRNGLPPEADLVFDVRCLPNPFYVPELRSHTGDESCVRDYVMQFPQTRELLDRMEQLVAFQIPLFIREGKSQLVIAVGCTGGRHRSVASAEHMAAFLREQGYRVSVLHRDRDKVQA